jgi:hypothetical protein
LSTPSSHPNRAISPFSEYWEYSRLTRTNAVKIGIFLNLHIIRPTSTDPTGRMWGQLEERRQFLVRNRTTANTRNPCIKLMKICAIFEYIISLLVKDTHDRIFRKNTSNIPVGNGSSLNITIPIKIIALTNIRIIKTTVLLLYLLVHYLIFNLPLLCTSS